jgi:hypothetical protein
VAYWAASIALIVFGSLAGFSIGQPFFLVGLAMFLLGAFRHRPLVFWPPLLAVIAYDVVYWALAPFGCSITIDAAGADQASCTSLAGLRYVGDGDGFPSLTPAVTAALLGALLTYVLSFGAIWVSRRSRTPSSA